MLISYKLYKVILTFPVECSAMLAANRVDYKSYSHLKFSVAKSLQNTPFHLDVSLLYHLNMSPIENNC